jgi:hypothetical protein
MKTRIAILALFGACFFNVATVSAQRVIRVVDFRSRTGVTSEIFKRSASGTEISLGDTNPKGELNIPPGARGERLRAVPKSPRYYDSSTDCPLKAKQTIVEVVAIDSLGGIGQRMLVKARDAEAAGKPAEAALALKEVIRSAQNDPALASLLQKRILDLGGEIFDVQTPARQQPDQMVTWTATPRLKEQIRDFQELCGLEATAVLDRKTLTKAVERERNSAMTTTSRPQ